MMNDNICANCIHAEVCGWCDSVTQDACDFYEFDGDWIKADVLRETRQEIRQEITNLVKTYPFIDHKDTYVKEDEVLEIIDKYLDKLK